MKTDRSARRIIVLLVASFALTIIGFMSATVVSQVQTQRIRREASLLGDNALLAADALAHVRTELMTTAVLLHTATAPTSPEATAGASRTRDELDASRRRIAQRYLEYAELPFFPGEHALAERLGLAIDDMNRSIEHVLQRLDAGDRAGAAEEVITRCEPAIVRADASSASTAGFNRRMARESASKISELARPWGWVPDAVSAVFALAAAYLAVRVVRRYSALLEQRTRELEHFAGRAAHDIRSPLSTLSFALGLVKRDPAVDETTRGAVERAVRTLQRLGQLLEGLLVFATAEKIRPATSGANARTVLDGVVEDAQPVARAKGITLDYEPPDPAVVVACSPGVLISVAANLVSNAIKYMGDAPVKRVSVRARPVRRAFRVEVSDTGPGIPSALRATLFDPHVRGPESGIPGLGLGLATVRRLAEAHGGVVGFQPNPGGGTTFWVHLPRQDTRERRGELAPAAAPRLAFRRP